MSELKIKQNVYWELIGPDGVVKDCGTVHNLVLTDGFEIICDRLTGLGAQPNLKCIAIGDSNTAAQASQTDLQGSELAFQASTNSRDGSNVAIMYTTYAAGVGTGTIKETVIADTVAAKGSRKCAGRTVLPDIVKGAGDTLTIIWEFIFEEA
jgi:hypothetical protein